MREISIFEMDLISGAAGAGDVANGATIGGALGGAAGASYAMAIGGTGSAVAGLAGIGAAAGAGLGTALIGGYAAGTWLNENTGIQGAISSMLPDPSGTDYNASGTNYN